MFQALSDVLTLFSRDCPQLSMQEIASALGWPKRTAARTLARIERAGFLERDEASGLYRLGIRLAILGGLAGQAPAVHRVATNALHRLSVETGETATLMILNDHHAVTIDVVESYHPIMVPGLLGSPQPLHATAGGKAMLAFATPASRQDLIRPPLARFTATTITNVDTLTRDLDMARQRGYAFSNGEYVDDVVALSAPVFDHRGVVRAALTVAGTSARIVPKTDTISAVLSGAATSVSALLGYQNPDHHPALARRATSAPSSRSESRLPARHKRKGDRSAGKARRIATSRRRHT